MAILTTAVNGITVRAGYDPTIGVLASLEITQDHDRQHDPAAPERLTSQAAIRAAHGGMIHEERRGPA